MSHAPTPPEPRGFSQQLKQAEALAQGGSVRIGELERLFLGRTFASAIAVLCLPFLQPLPVPGLSVVLGFVIAALGARLIIGRAEALPHFLARREVDAGKLRAVLRGAQSLFLRLDPLFRRRLLFLVDPPFGRLVGVGCIVGGLALAMPLPPMVLFSNGLPAFGVLLLCLGWIERDGLFVLLGHLVAFGTWIYFATWWEVLKLALNEAWRRIA